MNTNIKKSLIIVIAFTVLALIAGCAHDKSNGDTATPQKQEKSEKNDKKDETKIEVKGTPAPGSKFAKLKSGMTLKEVIAKIGEPDSQWQRPTGKSHIPFYFGDDRWVVEFSYKKEGKLTFNGGGDQKLTAIEVNKNE